MIAELRLLRIPLICAALSLTVFAIYAPTLHHGFTNFDDPEYVTDNTLVLQGVTLVGIRNAFTGYTCENWHPLTMISHMCDVQLFGLRAGAHHGVNLFLHALNSVILFLVLYSMTGALWRSATVAALFAAHPLHVESVAWIAERKDLLSGLFFMLTLAAYLRYVRRPFAWGNYLLLLVLFALGLLSKPMLVTLPFVLLLLDWWPLNRWKGVPAWRLLLEKIPLIALSAGNCLMTLHAQTSALSPWDRVPLSLRVANACFAYAAYLSKTFYPDSLCIFYPLLIRGWTGWNFAAIAKPTLLLVVLTLACALFRRGKPYLLLGWLWFLGMMVPVIGIIQVGAQSYADRYSYLPLIGVFIAVTWLFADWFIKMNYWCKVLPAIAILISLILCSRHQVAYWEDNEVLWRHVLECTPEHPLPLNNLAEVLMSRGRIPEAIGEIRKILAFSPGNARTHNNLANALLKSGHPDEALFEFREALRLDPSLGAVRQNIAKVLYGQGYHAAGIMEMRQVLLLKTIPPSVENDLAWMLATAPEASLRDGRKALELAKHASDSLGGGDSNALDTLAAAYAETGDFTSAQQTARKALGKAESSGNKELAETIRREISLYEEGKPLREP